MLVNTTWLLEYLEEPCSEKELLNAIQSAGIEVEAYRKLARELESITIGFVRDKAPIAGAEGLYICRVEVESGNTLQLVCASEHPVEVGWGVPIARGGTKLPTGIQIKSERFHGISSQGMICLDSELGMIARGSGLQVFHDESAMGQRLVDLIDVPDSIIEIKVTPNRPDWLGLIGIAREAAAILGLSLKLPPAPIEEGGTPAAKLASVEIKEPDLCRRYMCRIINGVSIAKSPAWLSSRLRSTGSAPINNVVDITNYVLREWGQPLHAFDYNTLIGPRIIVRKMEPSEKLELIDGTVISGQKTPLVIADADRPVALAGIMGGKNTQINNGTTDVLLEAAYFDPVQIKTALKNLNLDSTDASYRFERGMDPNEALPMALERAASLIAQVAGGTIARGAIDEYVNKMEPRKFHLSPERVNSYLGMEVSEATIQDSLQRLGMKCSADLVVEVPTRRVDVNDAVVLIEDVARMVGYDKIPLARPVGELTSGKRNSLDALRRQVTLFLANNGFLESRNISLESHGMVHEFSPEVEDAVRLVNSKEDMSVLRKSLLPGLLETISRNARREAQNFRYFELDRAFRQTPEGTVENWNAAAIAGGTTRDLDWSTNKTKIDFFYLKGVVESLAEMLGITGVRFRPASRRGFIDGQTAEIEIGNKVSGVIGAIDKSLLASRKIKEAIYAFELNLRDLLDASPGVQRFKDIPRTPAVVRDIGLVIDESIPYAELEKRIREVGGALLENIHCIDVYRGEHIQRGSRGISIRLRFRDPERTLSANEVSLAVERIVNDLTQEYGAKLRE